MYNKLPNQQIDLEHLIEQEKCKRLVVSINAIYILIQTIKRMNDWNMASENRSSELYCVMQHLSDFEDYLVKKTYIVPASYYSDTNSLNMNNYRLNKGIDSTEIEKRNTKAIQKYYYDNAIDAINNLHKEYDDLTFEKASEIKAKLRKKLNDVPECDLKEFIIELVDNESQFICQSLIMKNEEKAEFSESKKSIHNLLGSSSNILPEKTINALATAELLFSRYANPDYAAMCFDYSCISALYYQAVESMYNELLWKKYAIVLNNMEDEGEPFPELYHSGKYLPKHLICYLPIGQRNIGYYSDDEGIKSTLPMGSFQAIFSTITREAKYHLSGFRTFVDDIFEFSGIPNNSSIYRSYQDRIDEFNSQLKIAIPKRNAASHGEKPILIDECKNDKLLVLSDLESVRNRHLGLVKLFLSLYKSNN